MFKTVEDVNNLSDAEILKLVKSCGDVSDILHPEIYGRYLEANSVVRESENLAEKIAFAIRDKYNSIIENEDEISFDEDGFYEDDIDEFMNNIAYDLGKNYNGEYEFRPDSFWVPSVC